MKRWMSLAVGIALVAASCSAQSGTDNASESDETTTSAMVTTVTSLASTTTAPTTATTTPPAPPTTATATTAVPTPTTTSAPATRAPPTTTAVPAIHYAVANPANPTYYPGPLPGAGIYYGSGCSPGTSTLADGIWFGDITSVSTGSFEFDLMCFAPLPAGSTEEDGIGDITNTNPTLRTVTVDPSADVYILDLATSWVQQPYSTWHVDTGAVNGCPLEWCSAVWLYVNGGTATEIMVIWTP